MKITELLSEAESDTITLYHGGRGLEYGGHREIVPNAKGRWEHGPGLYLTTSYSRARSYAKGGRKVYKVVIRRGTNLRGSTISYQAVQQFTKQYIMARSRKSFIEDINTIMARYDLTDRVPSDVFVNLIINDNLLSSSKTPVLNKFLVDNGIDYSIVTNYGGSGETVVALFNRNLIVDVSPLGKETITDYNVSFPWNT